MQQTSGIRRILSIGWIYELFQISVGARHSRNWLLKNFWKLKGHEKVIDVGCGPGDILKWLPSSVEYVGFDVSPEYVHSANQRWGKRATFVVGTPGEMVKTFDERLGGADIVICNGVLHHLEDREAVEVFQLAKLCLKPGGRFIAIEPVFLIHQGWFSKWIMNQDRGKNIRTEREWKAILDQALEKHTTNIASHLLRIPYIHILIEYVKD